jgi:hypothetical protein
MSSQLTVNSLFNPFSSEPNAPVSVAARGVLLAMAVCAVLVLIVMAGFYTGLAEVRGALLNVFSKAERLEAAYNWRGGAAGASTGFMSETSDTLLGGTSYGQGQAVRLDKSRSERLVPGNNTWPAPTESVAREWQFSKSPCGGKGRDSDDSEMGSQGVVRHGSEHLSARMGPQWQSEALLSSRSAATDRSQYAEGLRGRAERLHEDNGLEAVLHGAM